MIKIPKIVWLSLSLAFSIFYSCLGLQQAFSSEYIVQDDARQHVFWMMRFIDPALFPNDFIADYFQSVAPLAYKTIYQLAAAIGINPLFFNKILPLFIGLITTFYCFAFSLEILPLPGTAFISSLVLNQNLWMKDDLVSATPRAFSYVLILAFLYYLSRRYLVPVLIAIALIGLIYPHCIFLAGGLLIIRLFKKKEKGFYLSQNPQDYRFCFLGLGVAFLVMLPYALSHSVFDPIITVAQAKQLPEFLPGGRTEFFSQRLDEYFIYGKRSGMFPMYPFIPLTLVSGVFLPLLLKFPSRFPLVKRIQPNIILLPQLLFGSLGMFFIAHAFIFRLHLPNRYTAYSFRIIIALSTGITLSLILDALLNWVAKKTISFSRRRQVIALSFIGLIVGAILFYPNTMKRFPITLYVEGNEPKLYEFFKQQPKDILIASLAEDTNSNLPSFTQRSIFIGREYSIPYHWGYYRKFRQRAIALIQTQYSSSLEEVKRFIKNHHIDFFLLDKNAFTPEYLADNSWLQQFQPYAKQAQQRLERGNLPILANFIKDCSVFETKYRVVLSAKCISGSTSKRMSKNQAI
ncbi:hypothetical protein NIES593_14125 [Hydrococcus rivularis NIES-593]|uniref:Glycosyltransferase RgtA/B/C/D-like domain-containing protein n=1 Tax=Hydrococcus rivularis NIES-593 TaxID=1921803 RepID=A0A1U7HER3_9CYAN|nr:hypothetical protein [Hydrococcus rivularis]OKH22066.1 hypothetical protein NIES593_14125 [Hydrococcus rivularis NIES-593]